MAKKKAKTDNGQESGFRNRVIQRKRIKAKDLLANPDNWREHPDSQRKALQDLLEEVGQVGEVYAYHSKRAKGKLTLIDGHLRSDLDPEQEWDVAICDLTDEEADKLLLFRDPIAGLATANGEAVRLLAERAAIGAESLRELAQSFSNMVVEQEPPSEFPEYDESIETQHRCPRCGYEWSGESKAGIPDPDDGGD